MGGGMITGDAEWNGKWFPGPKRVQMECKTCGWKTDERISSRWETSFTWAIFQGMQELIKHWKSEGHGPEKLSAVRHYGFHAGRMICSLALDIAVWILFAPTAVVWLVTWPLWKLHALIDKFVGVTAR